LLHLFEVLLPIVVEVKLPANSSRAVGEVAEKSFVGGEPET